MTIQAEAPPKARFLPYQIAWIKNNARQSIYVKSRRIGITWAEAFRSVRNGIVYKIDHIFCSLNEKTAREFLFYCTRFAEAVNVALDTEYIDLNGVTSEVLRFPNGARIITTSSNPAAMRGLGGDCTIDEMDWQEDQEALFTAAGPVVDWGGHLRLISTYCPSEVTPFCRISKDPEEYGFVKFQTTLVDAVEQGLAELQPGDHHGEPDMRAAFIKAKRLKCFSEGMYKQEYMCQHSDQDTIITPEVYDKCVVPGLAITGDMPDISAAGPCYLGVDVGRTNDSTAITLIEQGQNLKAPPKQRVVYRTRMVKLLRGMPFAGQFEVISAIIANKKIKRALIESNGIGMQLAEQLEAAFPGRAYGWQATRVSQSISLERFSGWVHQERFFVSPDPDIRADICALQRVVSDKKLICYDGRSKLGHCDTYHSGAIALEAAEGEPSFFESGGVSR